MKTGETQLEALVKQRGELGGIGLGRTVGELFGADILDARFGGVGENVLEVGVFGQCKEGVVILVGVDAAGNGGDLAQTVDLLAVLHAALVQVIPAALFIQNIHHAALDGLHHHDAAREGAHFVHLMDKVVDEAAEESALAELQYGFSSFIHI